MGVHILEKLWHLSRKLVYDAFFKKVVSQLQEKVAVCWAE